MSQSSTPTPPTDGAADCVFCQKFEGNDSEVMIFTPLNPVVEGHLLVVPRKHVADFSEDPQTTALVMADAANFVKEAAGDYNLITSKGKYATQTVFHLHVHLVPRVAGDGLKLPWTDQAHALLTAEIEQLTKEKV